ncbi:MAG: DUF1616 domain-containing protein [Euryarchaeota archaeon]|nr:DUF1616 domain-containing protein [Euryarchaeota archaeon]
MKERTINIIAVATIIAFAGLIAYALHTPHPKETFTEFWIEPKSIPKTGIIGKPLSFTIGVTNHEGRVMNYIYTVKQNGAQVDRGWLSLADGQNYTKVLTITPNIAGKAKVEVDLYNQTSSEPYREVHFWLDVK